MDRKKSQSFNYAYEAMPIMFHTQTNDFITYLERDGMQFLEFWWNYIGEQINEDQARPFEGLDFKISHPDDKQTMIVLTMPQPVSDGEVHHLLMIMKPEKRFAWVKLPNTRVIALIQKEAPENPEGTELGDITPRGIYVRLRKGPAPSVENMTKIGKALIKAEPK